MLKLTPTNFLGKLAEFFYQYVDISNSYLFIIHNNAI